MTTEPKLESYLARLDKALGQIPVGDRADIITEIKSHVLEARERNPEQELGAVLASLGEPESVANRYLLERGLKPGKPARVPMVKWLTIGFLGTVGIGCLTFLILVWKFSPIIQVDEENDKVVLLGGTIRIEGDGKYQTFEGSKALDAARFKEVQIPFTNGKMELLPSTDGKLRWRCKVNGNETASASEKGKAFVLDLENTRGAKCEVELPPRLKSIVHGNNGKVEIVRPQADMDIELDNGKISIAPDPAKNYRYETHVDNGMVSGLKSSDASDAVRIKISVANGKISST